MADGFIRPYSVLFFHLEGWVEMFRVTTQVTKTGLTNLYAH